MITIQGNTGIYTGTSTDSKPTENVPTNTKFEELDTGDTYFYNGETWVKIGG